MQHGSSFVQNAARLVGGAVAGQLVLLAASPILTRLYTPDDFGLLAVSMSFFAFTAAMSSGKYELAIPIAQSEEESASLVVVCLSLAFAFTLACCASMVLFDTTYARILGMKISPVYLIVLILGVLLAAGHLILQNIAVRRSQFSTLALSKVGQAVSTTVVQIGGCLIDPISLVVGVLAGHLYGICRLGRNQFAGLRASLPGWAAPMAAARLHVKFPMYTVPAGLMNTISVQAAPVVLASMFSPETAGQYLIAFRTLSIPATNVSQATSRVFFSGAAEAYRKGTLAPTVVRTHRVLVLICAPGLVFTAMFAPQIFVIVFGAAWDSAGTMAAWLILAVAGSFVTAPISSAFMVMGDHRVGFFLQTFLAIVSVSALVAGGLTGEPLDAVRYYSLASLFGYTVYSFFVFKYCGATTWQYVKNIGGSCVICAVFWAFAMLLNTMDQNPWLDASIYVFVWMIYMGLLWQTANTQDRKIA